MNPSQPTSNLSLPEPVDNGSVPSAPQGVAVPAPPRADNSVPQTAPSQQTHLQRPEVGDTLSPQWISAVEQAVRTGIDDPRTLSLQLDELRSQYLSDRFAKDIKRQGGGK